MTKRAGADAHADLSPAVSATKQEIKTPALGGGTHCRSNPGT